jgi:hypothetical protein
MVLLSPGSLDGADLGRMRGEGLSKLIISGSFAPGLDDAVELMQASIGWTVAVRYPSAERGTGLLGGDHAISVADKIASFVREQAEQSGPGLLRAQAG